MKLENDSTTVKKFLCFFLMSLMLFSCNTKPTYKWQKLDSYSFRRDYAGADSLKGAALLRYLNRNPITNIDHAKGNFFEYLSKANIIQNGTLQLSNLDTLYNTFEYTIQDKIFKVAIDFKYLSEDDSNNFIFAFLQEKDTIFRDTLQFGFPPDVIFSKNDLDKNGTDELYALFKNYAVEGDNFELSVYELK
ncbi:MAG: hypothetical protein AAF617_02050 [Bacteroidota bacterium]